MGGVAGRCPVCLLKRGMEPNTAGYTAEDAAPWTPPTAEELAGVFPELEVVCLLGRGGMGAVYRARQKQLDRVVALKILPPEMAGDAARGGFAERFAREAQTLAKLNHPHIVTLYEFGERQGVYFFIMEYVDGMNLRGLLDAGQIAPKEALAIVTQICEALQYAHDHGIVHRDIKPENILLNRQGQVKIADFGLAKLMGRASPLVEKVMGTPQYMAPEQIERPAEVDHRADIYSLGVVFYQMLTGQLPRGAIAPPSRRVQIDVRLDEVVLRALEKEPERRYQQASEVKTVVETILLTASHVNANVATPLRGVAEKDAPPPTPRLSRTAIFGAVLGVLWLPVVVWAVFNCFQVEESPFGIGEMSALIVSMGVILLSIPAPFFATFLGYVAIGQIRRSGGRLYGLGLAVVDMLFYPLQVLNVVICLLCMLVRVPLMRDEEGLTSYASFVPFLIFAILLCVLVDILIIRWVYRRLRRAPDHEPSSSQPPVSLPSNLPSVAPRLSRIAILGVVWAVMFWVTGLTLRISPAYDSFTKFILTIWAIVFGVAPLLGTTILGYVAIRQIRHSAGRLYGLGLAVFDLLFFPLLLLNFAFASPYLWGMRELQRTGLPWSYEVILWGVGGLVVLVLCVLADIWIVRRVWRKIRQPQNSSLSAVLLLALGILISAFLLLVGVSVLNRHMQLYRPARPHTDSYPRSAHLGGYDASAYVVHDKVKLHYVLFYAGEFDSSSSGSHNTHSLLWMDKGSLTLLRNPDKRTFGFLRESVSPSFLDINGQQFDLRQGQVLELHDDGTVSQLPLFPPLTVGQDINVKALAERITAARRGETRIERTFGTFKDDPALLGTWQAEDFVLDPNDFKPGTKHWTGAWSLNELTFLPDGRTSPFWWGWTKGLILNPGDFNSGYEIRRIDDQDYLFLEWKSDVIEPYIQPHHYYVLRRKGDEPVTSQPVVSETWKRTLSNGVIVELLGVSDNPSQDKPWWRPDGSPLAERPYEKIGATSYAGDDERAYEVAVRVTPPPGISAQDIAEEWKIDSSRGQAGGSSKDEGPYTTGRSTKFPRSLERTAVHIGIAAGPWTMLENFLPGSSRSTSNGGYYFNNTPGAENNGNATVSVSHNRGDQDVRLIAIDKEGQVHQRGHQSSSMAGDSFLLTKEFSNLRLGDVKEFQFQTRLYEWVEFKNVTLRPRP